MTGSRTSAGNGGVTQSSATQGSLRMPHSWRCIRIWIAALLLCSAAALEIGLDIHLALVVIGGILGAAAAFRRAWSAKIECADGDVVIPVFLNLFRRRLRGVTDCSITPHWPSYSNGFCLAFWRGSRLLWLSVLRRWPWEIAVPLDGPGSRDRLGNRQKAVRWAWEAADMFDAAGFDVHIEGARWVGEGRGPLLR